MAKNWLFSYSVDPIPLKFISSSCFLKICVMFHLYVFLPFQYSSLAVNFSCRYQMKPYHMLWAWDLKNVMQRGHWEWAIKWLGVLLIFLLRRVQKEHRKERRILGEEPKSCWCDLDNVILMYSVFSCQWCSLIHKFLQGAKKVWNDTLKESCGS